ncbi:phage/plasmid primase, P4 family [Bizionia sp. M204]|uniref:DNA primase family protein n=1 Tax=Bizionia sp. M204 TaxID=2675331 RepID=UPI002067F416|nr:phage/plasmid primase, P4 family [Bizionia sp. M204]UPS92829.1 DNA primase [Bizionia sp. M204]
MKNTNIRIDEILNETNSLIQEIESDKDKLKQVENILKEIPKQIKPVNFREYCKLESNKDKLFGKHYRIAVVEILLKTVDATGFSLCRKNEQIYVFNSEYWECVGTEIFKDFLGNAALKMKVDKFDAKDYDFKEKLFKQFIADAGLKEIKPKIGTTLINLKNGTFEITPKKQFLRPFQKSDFLIYQLPFSYNHEAKALLFNKFLNEVLPEKELQDILAEYLASIFINNNNIKIEKVLLLYGTGANGKSVIFDIIMALLGSKNVSNYSLHSLTSENSKSRINLLDKLLNYSSEINGKLESNIFKAMASCEPIEVPVLYKQTIVATEYARLMFNCNELPKEVENTNAFFRRFLILPFRVTFPEEKQDKELSKKIIDNELSGVFNWILEGLQRLLNNKNFTESDIVKNEVLQYQKESDSVLLFLEDENYIISITSFHSLKEIYSEYKQYCHDNGYRQVSSKNLSKRLEKAGYTKAHKRIGTSFNIEKKISF